jgi:hypothetical protein
MTAKTIHARFPEPTVIGDENLRGYLNELVRSLYEVQVVDDQRHLKKVVIVQKPSDLAGDLDSTFLYLIDGVIDLGTQSVTVPEGGLSIAGHAGGRDVCVLTSSEDNYSMFITDTYSGNVVMETMTCTVTGTNSQVFDLDNSGNGDAIDISNVNFTDCVSLGEMSNYRQLLMNLVGFIFIDDGLTLSGTWSGGMSIINSIAVVFPAATLFKEGTSLTFAGSVRSNINFLSVDASAVLFDFEEANVTGDGEFDLQDVRTEATNAIPNFDHTDVKARFRNCLGIDNTYVGAEWELTTTAVTTISTANTLVKMAGTTTYSEEHWFGNTTDNAFVYESSLTIEANVLGNVSLTGTNNKVAGVQIRHWDDSASAYVDIGPRYSATMNGGGAGTKAENVAIFASVTLDENDRVEIWLENQSDTSNITGDVGCFVKVEEKSS